MSSLRNRVLMLSKEMFFTLVIIFVVEIVHCPKLWPWKVELAGQKKIFYKRNDPKMHIFVSFLKQFWAREPLRAFVTSPSRARALARLWIASFEPWKARKKWREPSQAREPKKLVPPLLFTGVRNSYIFVRFSSFSLAGRDNGGRFLPLLFVNHQG